MQHPEDPVFVGIKCRPIRPIQIFSAKLHIEGWTKYDYLATSRKGEAAIVSDCTVYTAAPLLCSALLSLLTVV
jgi:hypothetical protein